MNKSKKIIKISLVFIMISALLVIIAMVNLRIDKPLFLQNYYEVGIYENEGIYSIEENFLNLQYIANIDDERYVTGITFKEAPNTYFSASEYDRWNSMMFSQSDYSNVQKYGIYGIHTVYLTCLDFKYEGNLEELILSNATIKFNDGLKMDVDLGKIAFYKEINTPVALEGISIKGSSDGLASMTFRVKEDIKIEKIESALFEDTSEVFDFNINYMDYDKNKVVDYKEGATIKENALITISSNFNNNKNILENYTIYKIRPKIYFVNNYNDKYSFRYYDMTNYNPHYTYYGLYKYLKIRGSL